MAYEMPKQDILIEVSDEGKRLDVTLARIFADRFSRSQIKKMIGQGLVKVGGREVSAHYPVKAGEKIAVEWGESVDDSMRAEDIPIEILAEDEDVIVVNKPPGMVVHPACGNPHHTLVNALLFHARGLSSLGGAVRPGIVHRLDKDTSGVMVVAKNDQAHAFLARQFKDHQIDRTYEAMVQGVVQHEEGLIDEPVGRAFLNRKKVVVKPSGGKSALTYYRVKERFKRATWLEVKPRTGRTHQIRVHLAHLGHPVLGDSFYGVKTPAIQRQALHASMLGFLHPRTRQKVSFHSELPSDMEGLIRFLKDS